MKLFRIEIVTQMERNLALQLLTDIISTHEGWIVNHQLFSNIAASIVFELPSDKMKDLCVSIESAGFKTDSDESFSVKTKEIRGSLAITFIHDEPDLKRNIPAFG